MPCAAYKSQPIRSRPYKDYSEAPADTAAAFKVRPQQKAASKAEKTLYKALNFIGAYTPATTTNADNRLSRSLPVRKKRRMILYL